MFEQQQQQLREAMNGNPMELMTELAQALLPVHY